jgi:hypothetical protein
MKPLPQVSKILQKTLTSVPINLSASDSLFSECIVQKYLTSEQKVSVGMILIAITMIAVSLGSAFRGRLQSMFRWDANNRLVLVSTFAIVVALFLFYCDTPNSTNSNIGWPGAKGSRIRVPPLDIDNALIHGNETVEWCS